MRELLGRGANVNAVLTDSGSTSLMEACTAGHLEVVRELIGRGANVNAARTDDAWTSLMFSCKHEHLEVARFLLAHHANRALVSASGRTAYDHTTAANAELRALVKP